MFRSKNYSLHKSRHILKAAYKSYQRKYKSLAPERKKFLEERLEALDQAVLSQNREEANRLALELEPFLKEKSTWDYIREIGFAIVVALLIATVVRQMWFELYEIPTGSMRPTFKEQDHLTVTKTTFGLNIPLQTAHFYFDPALVQRTGVVIWSGDGIPHLDSDSTFMGIFPYTKRYIKRAMGKPGDTLYFYGGKIFGFDKEGNDLVDLRNSTHIEKLEHIPFTNFEGRRAFVQDSKTKLIKSAVFNHFNLNAGRYRFQSNGIDGEVFNGKEWLKDNPLAQSKPHEGIQTYSDLWGIRNYALARLLSKKEVEQFTSYPLDKMEEGLLYLELRHTPSLSYPAPLLSEYGANIKGFSTLLPLKEKHLKALMENMYTCRFLVQNGKAFPYRVEGKKSPSKTSPSFAGLEDGTYEMYYGKGYKIGFGGYASLLPKEDPIYSLKPEHVQRLFNVGIEMNTHIEPQSEQQPFFPNRYVYFRDGSLYAMGGILMDKEDPLLNSFNEREEKRANEASEKEPYVGFKDYGPPINENGELDKSFISAFGLKIPEKHYLALGDNHAMSQDSRSFGPIPEANLQGAPSLIIWPPGERWGIPNQKPYPLITVPRLMVWGTALLITIIWWIVRQRNMKKPIYKKLG
ncbi:MAG: S26 family signal peptidase [Parachlamydia sp.]|jgi:signal peptidase I|nr:S26 family signal peptidase [Parachlamydia sp.]